MTGEGVGFMAYRQKTGNLAPILCPSLNVIKYFLCWALLPSAADAGKHLEMKSNSLWSCWWLVAGLVWPPAEDRERGTTAVLILASRAARAARRKQL